MKQIGILLAILIFTSCTHMGRNELPSERSDAPHLRRFIQKMVIPEIDLNDASLEDAIQFLVKSGSENNHPSMSIIAMHEVKIETGITIHGKDLSFFDVLDEICDQSGMKWQIIGKILIFNPDHIEKATSKEFEMYNGSDPFRVQSVQPITSPNPSGPVR